jgi:phosphatidate cytidylyltransferase
VKRRIVSTCLLVPAFVLAGLYLPATGGWLVLLFLAALGSLEFYGILSAGKLPAFRYVGLLCGALLITATFFALVGPLSSAVGNGKAHDFERSALVIAVLAIMLRQFPQKNNPQPVVTMAGTLLGVLYVPFLLNFVTRLAYGWDPASLLSPIGPTGRWLVFYLVAVVKANDIGAFLVGTAIGRHKLLPRISPGKTWEGLLGGFAASLAASLLIFVALRQAGEPGVARFGALAFHARDAWILAVLLAAAGTFGDLAESLVKRGCGTKDSGRLIPGMGGVLDLLDSLLFGAPVLYAYARFFLQ